jgi:predicted DNA-binding transcriptional regulator AlpA
MEAVMEKLTIREASERFGLSRARLFKLLDKGIVAGHLSKQRGGAGDSWINAESLKYHFDNRDKKVGRPRLKSDDNNYIPVKTAAQKLKYTASHIYHLIKQGSVTSKIRGGGIFVSYPELLIYQRK